jgi:hypothetical protein
LRLLVSKSSGLISPKARTEGIHDPGDPNDPDATGPGVASSGSDDALADSSDEDAGLGTEWINGDDAINDPVSGVAAGPDPE